MRYYHRHSFFPLVIILLTLLLGLFMVLTLSRESLLTAFPEEEITAPVDAQFYRGELLGVITTFEIDVGLASDDLATLIVVERAFEGLLALRVPPENKQLHLELALIFSKMQTTLKGEDRNIEAMLAQLQALKETL
ncbi:MAG: hypothetical protein WC654_03130 [Patescibacteria group bacterium]